MARQVKYSVGVIATLLVILWPSPALAQDFSVSPAEVNIANLSAGEEAEFTLTIHNKDDVGHVFTLTSYNPEKSQRRQGRAEFPDDNWVSFSPQRVEVQAKSEAELKVMVDIPSDLKWLGRDWEVWLEVNPELSDLLTVKLYVRLLASTSKGARGSSNIWLVVGIAMVIVLVGCGVYYFTSRRRYR
jgi:Fn3-like domain (DUF1034).